MVDPVTDPLFSQFSANDRAFLGDMFLRHSKVGQNFVRYLSLPSFEQRAFTMLFDLQIMKRAGWVNRGIKNPETIRSHSAAVMHYALHEAPPGIAPFHATRMAAVHDIPEVIITDFTPTDKITSEEKEHLERLAIEVLTDKADMKELIIEYIEQKTPESHWAYDVDKLDSVFVALQYEAQYPEKMGVFREFWDDAKPKLKTAKGREILMDIEQYADEYRARYCTHFAQCNKRSQVKNSGLGIG